MSEDRPEERKRARKGLGARSPEGETTKANPKGRLTEIPGGTPSPHGAGSDFQNPRRARQPRARQAKRRTVRDNPEGLHP